MTHIIKNELKWRLADVAGEGVELVNVVLPELSTRQSGEVLLSTDIPSPHTSVADIQWSEEDQELFCLLLEKMMDFDFQNMQELDLSDPELIDVLHVVAAAHFLPPLDADEILADDLPTIMSELDVGDLVAIHTRDGFKSCVITGLDSIEALCVLLEPIDNLGEEYELDVYDTLLVNKHSILPADFGNVVPDVECCVH